MLKCLGIAFLLCASSHLGSQTRGSDVEDNDNNNNEPVPDLNIYSTSSETIIGGNVILECNSTDSCLPINFTLFLNNKTIGQAIKRKAMEKIVFNYTISSRSDFGEYKCKAQSRFNNVSNDKYSKGFNFTLRAAAAAAAADTPSPCKDSVRNLNIYSPSLETVIGGNVILECNSTDSCLPINFTLFLNNKTIGQAIKGKAMEKIVFNYTISSRSDLGEYKCKARNKYNNPTKGKYSKGFNFTLRATEEEKNKLIVFIVAPLLLLLLLITSVVAFRFLILPWCESKKRKSASKSSSYVPVNYAISGNCGTDDDEYGKDGQIEYCEVKTKIEREDCRKEMLSEDTAVTYAEIMIRR